MANTTADEQQNLYSEAQHFALVKSAVDRETAAVSEEKNVALKELASLEETHQAVTTQLAEVQSRVDVLESEKATAEANAAAAAKELADFRAEIEHEKAVQARKDERVSAVKAANANLPENYFTAERAQRWAEMSDEVFTALVGDLTDVPAVKAAADADAVRETAAFSGGTAPTDQAQGSTLGRFFIQAGKAPAVHTNS